MMRIGKLLRSKFVDVWDIRQVSDRDRRRYRGLLEKLARLALPTAPAEAIAGLDVSSLERLAAVFREIVRAEVA